MALKTNSAPATKTIALFCHTRSCQKQCMMYHLIILLFCNEQLTALVVSTYHTNKHPRCHYKVEQEAKLNHHATARSLAASISQIDHEMACMNNVQALPSKLHRLLRAPQPLPDLSRNLAGNFISQRPSPPELRQSPKDALGSSANHCFTQCWSLPGSAV